MDKVRIDKWLWAARFYKTRSLAKQAVEKGHVKLEGQRLKPSKDITTGMQLTLRVGWDDITVDVLALSDQRRGAPQARLLYAETPESIEKRASNAAQRKLVNQLQTFPDKKPTKKQRRQIHKFREQDLL